MTFRRILGIVLIIAAIVFCVILPSAHISACYFFWSIDPLEQFVSIWDCLWTNSRSHLLFLQALGIILGTWGLRCLETDLNRHKIARALLIFFGIVLLANIALSLAIGVDTWNLDDNLHRAYSFFLHYYFSFNTSFLLILSAVLLFPLVSGVTLLGENLPPADNHPVF